MELMNQYDFRSKTMALIHLIYRKVHHLVWSARQAFISANHFRRAQFRTLGRLAKSHMEHEQIVVAILRGDRDRAARAMNAHILTVREAYGVYAGALSPETAALSAANH